MVPTNWVPGVVPPVPVNDQFWPPVAAMVTVCPLGVIVTLLPCARVTLSYSVFAPIVRLFTTCPLATFCEATALSWIALRLTPFAATARAVVAVVAVVAVTAAVALSALLAVPEKIAYGAGVTGCS